MVATMRFFPGLIFALCVLPVCAGESPGSKYQFQWDAEAGKISMPDILKRLKALVPRLSKPDMDAALEFLQLYATAMKRAQGADFHQLENLLRLVPADSVCFDECFSI